MIKKEIKYFDAFAEEEVTKPFYFHLHKADIMRIIGRDREGDWEKYVQKIMDSNDNDKVMNFIEDIIRDSVGQRTEFGFTKNRTYADAFIGSDAYGELFMELIQEEGAAERFFRGVIGKLADGTPKAAVKARTTRKK